MTTDEIYVAVEFWTIIVAAPDCSSVQCVSSAGVDAEDAARRAFERFEWLGDFELIAVVLGVPTLYVRDDVRTAERGLMKVDTLDDLYQRAFAPFTTD